MATFTKGKVLDALSYTNLRYVLLCTHTSQVLGAFMSQEHALLFTCMANVEVFDTFLNKTIASSKPIEKINAISH